MPDNNDFGMSMSDQTLGAYNIADLRELARRRLPRGIFEFVDRGAEDEVSLRNNRAVFERIRLNPRVLVDVSQRSQEIALFGQRHKMPVAIASTGTPGIMWHEGEIALARAAKAAGIPFTLATTSLTAMEKVVGGRITVMVDSGFRRGSDVIKAFALGAQAVLIGRAILYGVAAAGEAGAARALVIFREEIDRVLALLGCQNIAGVSRDCVVLPPEMQTAPQSGAEPARPRIEPVGEEGRTLLA